MAIAEGDDQIPRTQTPVGRSGSLHSIATDAIYNHRLLTDLVPSETDFPGNRDIPLKTSSFLVRMLSLTGGRTDRNVNPICTQRRSVAAIIDEFCKATSESCPTSLSSRINCTSTPSKM